MASISLVCYNGFFSCNDNLGPVVGKTGLGRKVVAFHSSVLGSSSLLVGITRKPQGFVFCSSSKWKPVGYCRCGSPSAGYGVCYNSRLGVSCKSRIGTLRDGGGASRVDEPTRLARSRRRRFSLRLRPRFRLWMMRLKTFSVRSMLDGYGMFLKKNGKRGTVYALVSAVFWLCYFLFRLTASPSSKVVPYSELIASLQDGRVSKVLVEEGSRRIYYNAKSEASGSAQNSEGGLAAVNVSDEQVANTIAEGDTVAKGKLAGISILKKKFSKPRASAPKWQFSTRKIDHDEKFLLSLMREKGTSYSSAPQSALVSMRNALITIIMLWIPLTPLMWLLHRQLSGGNSLAKKRKPKNQIVTFDDVEGVDIAKVELMEVVSCLQGAASYQKLGAKLPRGVLLSGPPGTGKTLLARAVAGEAGVPFFSVSASEFVEMFVGRGAARIRDLFNVARKNAPSIIFIDELDAVGGKRGRSFNDERDQTLNQLLTEMDGFESDMKVVVIAATNRPQALDPALCRPGRFSRKILVAEPDEEGRRKILAVHLREVPLEEDPDLICALVASLTPGFVGADLANIVNESALLAARRGREEVTREDVMEAIERAKFGITERQLRPSTITRELGKLFPWMPSSLTGKNVGQNSYEGGPLGYQSLS